MANKESHNKITSRGLKQMRFLSNQFPPLCHYENTSVERIETSGTWQRAPACCGVTIRTRQQRWNRFSNTGSFGSDPGGVRKRANPHEIMEYAIRRMRTAG